MHTILLEIFKDEEIFELYDIFFKMNGQMDVAENLMLKDGLLRGDVATRRILVDELRPSG